MDFLITYSCLFFIGGMAGWVIELFFRRFVSQHKWVNPGFLTGPLLPLYGFGVCALYFLCSLPYDWIPIAWLQKVVCVLFIGAAMTLVELIAGLIFIKGMKIKLWDYSNRWGNFQGIICPLFSLIWAAIGALYLFLLHPSFVKMIAFLLSHPLPLLFALGALYGILSVDLGYSFKLVVKIRKAVSDSKFVVAWDRIKSSFADKEKKLKIRHSWIFAFSSPNETNFKDMMADYQLKAMEDGKQFECRVAGKKALAVQRRMSRRAKWEKEKQK